MPPWMTQIAMTMFTGLVIGVILHVFKQKLDKSAETTKKANELDSSRVMTHIDTLKNKISSVEETLKKLDAQGSRTEHLVHKLQIQTEVIVNEQKHTAENIQILRQTGEKSASVLAEIRSDYGKVIRKP